MARYSPIFSRMNHEYGGLLRLLLPGGHTGGEGAVEAGCAELAEKFAEVDLALTHVQVLVNAGRGAGRVEDAAVAGGPGGVEGVGEVHVGEQVARVLDDAGGVVADVEGVRGAADRALGDAETSPPLGIRGI